MNRWLSNVLVRGITVQHEGRLYKTGRLNLLGFLTGSLSHRFARPDPSAPTRWDGGLGARRGFNSGYRPSRNKQPSGSEKSSLPLPRPPSPSSERATARRPGCGAAVWPCDPPYKVRGAFLNLASPMHDAMVWCAACRRPLSVACPRRDAGALDARCRDANAHRSPRRDDGCREIASTGWVTASASCRISGSS